MKSLAISLAKSLGVKLRKTLPDGMVVTTSGDFITLITGEYFIIKK